MDTERHMILVKRSYYAICLRILCSLGWAQFPHHSYFMTFSHSNLINAGIAAMGMSPENDADSYFGGDVHMKFKQHGYS
jgi:hypothetical protein